MKKFNWELLIILIIVVGSTLVKYWGIDKSPPSLGFDEAALGYNAYSIMMTGKDEYGNRFPLSLRSFNDYKPALYSYLSIPFIYFEGLNEISVRTVSVLAGGISVFFSYLILKQFVKKKWYLILGTFLIAFEPWRLHFSRNAFETNLSMCWFTIGVYFLVRTKNKWNYLWSILFFGLATYSYHAARLSAPFLLFLVALDPLMLVKEKKFFTKTGLFLKNNYKKFWPVLGLVFVCLPIFAMNNSKLLLTRFSQENVFKKFYPYTPKELLTAKIPFLDLKANPIYYFLGIVSGHIFAYLSPINLNFRIFSWVKESPQFIPGFSMLGWIEGILVLVGLIVLLQRMFKDINYRVVVYWLIAGIAPAAVTWNWFHPLRALNIFPALEILAVLGLIMIFENLNIKNNLIRWGGVGIFLGILAVTTIFTINNELLYSAVENNGEYQPGGFKEGMPFLKSIQDKYDTVIIDTPHAQSYIFLLFYEKLDPTIVQKYADVRPKPGVEGNLNFNFDKFVFRKVDWPKDHSLKKTVFWTSADVSTAEVNRVPGAKIQMQVKNVLYPTADIITTE